MDEITAPENASAAWARVRHNRGCAGVDGITITELDPVFEHAWAVVRAALLSGTYHPQPLRRVRIPKPSGGERLLGIPSVLDRVVHQAAAQVLSKRWEPRFSSRSFAYRPGRGPHDAVNCFLRETSPSTTWVLHFDIEDFFDSVPHPVVNECLKADLGDSRIARFMEDTLRIGVYDGGVVRPSARGLAQGSPLSPLLANAVLDRLDQHLAQRGHRFVRYADDGVVLAESTDQAELLRADVQQALVPLGLQLNGRKTRICTLDQARFLGFAFVPGPRGSFLSCASPEAIAEVETTLARLIATQGLSASEVASHAAAMLRSWLAYFYTPAGAVTLRALTERAAARWAQRFPGARRPACFSWESLVPAENYRPAGADYDGHFQAPQDPAAIDWAATWKCLCGRLWHSFAWHLEFSPPSNGFPLPRPSALQLCFGRNRLRFRL